MTDLTGYQPGEIEAATAGARLENGIIPHPMLEAGLKRIRPCLMTTATTIFGLLPVFWATGRGSDAMQPMAIPSIGGMSVSLITLVIAPCLFCAVEEWKWKKRRRP